MAEKEYQIKGELTEDMQFIKIDGWMALRRVFRDFIGKELLIKVSVLRRQRSDRKNRYIHGVVVPCVQAWFRETSGESHTHDEVYTWLRISLLGQKLRVVELAGESVTLMDGKRFSAMNTKEFAEAVEDIVAKMDEKECHIPLPSKENLLTDFIDE